MSSFPGPLPEIDGICIDYFELSKMSSAASPSAFFLSHAHTDHMVGLEGKALARYLQRSPGTSIYMSKITLALLSSWERGKFFDILPYAKPLDFEKEHEVEMSIIHRKRNRRVTVQLLPSGHCPGSVMFLFACMEGSSTTRVLYTGDFRLERGQLEEDPCFLALRRLRDEGLQIDALHLDTTFCSKQSRYFPSRRASADALIAVTKSWLDEAPENSVVLELVANFGYEFLLSELCKHLLPPGSSKIVHIARTRWQQYKSIPEIASLVTTDPNGARIHVGSCGCFGSVRSPFVKVIRPSAQFFTMSPDEEMEIVLEDKFFTRVFYSMHSSCSEIRDMIEYLKPKKVSANVVPKDKTSDVHEVLREIHESVMRETKSTSSELALQGRTWEISLPPRSPRRSRFSSTEVADAEPEANVVPQGASNRDRRTIRRSGRGNLQKTTVKREAEKCPKAVEEPVVKKKPLSLSQEGNTMRSFSTSGEAVQSAPSELCLDSLENDCPMDATGDAERGISSRMPNASSPSTSGVKEESSSSLKLVSEETDLVRKVAAQKPSKSEVIVKSEERSAPPMKKKAASSPSKAAPSGDERKIGASVPKIAESSGNSSRSSHVFKDQSSSSEVPDRKATVLNEVKSTTWQASDCSRGNADAGNPPEAVTVGNERSNPLEVVSAERASDQNVASSSSVPGHHSTSSNASRPSGSRFMEHPSSSPEIVEGRLPSRYLSSSTRNGAGIDAVVEVSEESELRSSSSQSFSQRITARLHAKASDIVRNLSLGSRATRAQRSCQDVHQTDELQASVVPGDDEVTVLAVSTRKRVVVDHVILVSDEEEVVSDLI